MSKGRKISDCNYLSMCPCSDSNRTGNGNSFASLSHLHTYILPIDAGLACNEIKTNRFKDGSKRQNEHTGKGKTTQASKHIEKDRCAQSDKRTRWCIEWEADPIGVAEMERSFTQNYEPVSLVMMMDDSCATKELTRKSSVGRGQ